MSQKLTSRECVRAHICASTPKVVRKTRPASTRMRVQDQLHTCACIGVIECISRSYTKRSPLDKWLPRVDQNQKHSLIHARLMPSELADAIQKMKISTVARLFCGEPLTLDSSCMATNSDGLQSRVNYSGDRIALNSLDIGSDTSEDVHTPVVESCEQQN